MPISKIEKELSSATKCKQGAKQDRQEYLRELSDAIQELPDEAWDALSDAAQKWQNAAASAINAKKKIKDFSDIGSVKPDADDDDEKPARGKKRAAKEEEDEDEEEETEEDEDEKPARGKKRPAKKSSKDDDEDEEEEEEDEKPSRSRKPARSSKSNDDDDDEDEDEEEEVDEEDEEDEEDEKPARGKKSPAKKAVKKASKSRDDDEEEEEEEDEEEEEEDEKPVKRRQRDGSANSKASKASAIPTTGYVEGTKDKIKQLVFDDPDIDVDAIVKKLGKGGAKVSRVTVSNIRAEYRHTVRFLKRQGIRGLDGKKH